MIMMKEYRTIEKLSGPLALVKQVEGVKLGELGEIEFAGGKALRCQVTEVDGSDVVVQLLESSTVKEMNTSNAKARFFGHGVELAVSQDMLGRVFNGMGDAVDGGPRLIPHKRLDINGNKTDPAAEKFSEELIQTGISAIDGLSPISLGQTATVFSDTGLSHNALVSQIIRQARICGSNERFAFVFAAVGITFEEYELFVSELKKAGVIDRTVTFVNLASDPDAERISLPRMALTAAEYLAFDLGLQVMVIMTDMTNYAEAIREVSASYRAACGSKNYANSLYSDLAAIYERAGKREDSDGSVTMIPIVTTPKGDKECPVSDVIKQLTDGQIVISRDTSSIDVLSSNSRGVNKSEVMNRLLTSYARGIEARARDTALDEEDVVFARFADKFEAQYINQGLRENRSIEETLDIGKKLLSMLSKDETN